MTQAGDINGVRASALARVERSERNYKLTFLAAAILEAAFLAGFILLADLSNRLHVLLLIATVATYTLVGLGLVALATHVTRSTLRVVRAVELLESRVAGERS